MVHDPGQRTRLTLTCHAVLFDVDGVLVDSLAVVERTWARWAARHAIRRTDIAQTAHGRRSIETVRQLAPRLDAATEVAWLESAELNDTQGLVALPGAAAALAAVPAARRALVTSGGRALAALRMRAAGLELPSIVVASRLGVDPRACVVIEDSPPGIIAGRTAGATVIAVATTFPGRLWLTPM